MKQTADAQQLLFNTWESIDDIQSEYNVEFNEELFIYRFSECVVEEVNEYFHENTEHTLVLTATIGTNIVQPTNTNQ